MSDLRSALRNVDCHFLILLDESKRILTDRFPRGFQDNLFALLYGDLAVSPHCSIVFAGSQELYGLSEDGTSPIGSRAAKHLITNLTLPATEALATSIAANVTVAEIQRRTGMLFEVSGGHAGTLARLAGRFMSSSGSQSDLDALVGRSGSSTRSCSGSGSAASLSRRVIADRLLSNNTLSIREVPRLLRDADWIPMFTDRAYEELLFTGIAVRDGDNLLIGNRVYGEVARSNITSQDVPTPETTLWASIQEVELGLRRVIRQRFDGQWGASADERLRDALGDEAWLAILARRQKQQTVYRSVQAIQYDVLEFTYLGQLGQVMMWRQAWHLFRGLFRDRRELEDMLRDISPVRNDQAHFRRVAPTELDRCRIRCNDLLAIVENCQSSGTPSE
jgi:hypothetical protein